ncbi:ABC transporter permease [Dactylosporangium sp. NPDC049525]|uniref:ABC transporter permease n=1 Tax=Dactylosporangium sp. NPDC049525 TaxID=3154730 RepID=UPI0034214B4E
MRRLAAVGRAELLLLARNRTAAFNAVLLPLLIIGLLGAGLADLDDPDATARLVTGMLGFTLLGVLYYTLVSAYVARREDLVLKRLRVGVLTDTEILIGTAGPAAVVALGQMVLFVVAGSVFAGLPVPANAAVMLIGVLGGTVVFVLLAAVSAGFTRTVELAQITTLPVLFLGFVGADFAVPADALPPAVAGTLRLLPLGPTLELVRLGWLGAPGQGALGLLGEAAAPAGLLAVWIVLGWLAVRRWFRWEPRR